MMGRPRILTPANFPELAAAAERFRQVVGETKAASLDQASRRRAIRQAEAAYLSVFGEIARRPNAAGDDPVAG
jgi:hypothetical protein